MTDRELLEASRRGERDAFGELVGRYQRVVCAVTYSRTRDRALSEDVAQETFLAAWRQLDQLREPGRLRAWLCGIARNLASKARRRRDRELPVEAPIALASESPFDAVSDAQAERVVSEALGRVPETYRDALVLYYREQRSAREVAEELGITEAAALQRLSRGRQYLADGLSSLVERSLRAQRAQRRDLVVGVLAALPVVTDPLRVDAATKVATTAKVSPGGSMLKLALTAALVAVTGATALAIHHRRGAEPPAAPAALAAAPAPAAPSARAPAPAPASRAASAPSAAPAGLAAPATEPPTEPPCGSGSGSGDCAARAAAEPPSAPLTPEIIARLGLERGPSRGPASAPVTIVVFTDMKCKYCGAALAAFDELFEALEGKIRLVVKQLPLRASNEVLSAAVLAADAQGKFWELHDLMLAHQDELSRDKVLELAQQAGLDVRELSAAIDADATTRALAADRAAAAELGITGTPTLFINGQRVDGLRPAAQLRAIIERALAARR